jgi:hypothetical protein
MISDYIDFAYNHFIRDRCTFGHGHFQVAQGSYLEGRDHSLSYLINLINSSISKCYFKGIPDRADPDGYRDCPV